MPGLTGVLAVACPATAALALAGTLTAPLRDFALRRGITDHPGPRKSHTQPTPYLGGVAVAVTTLAAAGCVLTVLGRWQPAEAVLLGTALLVGALGLADDLHPLGALPRLATEAAAATTVVLVAGHPVLLGARVPDAVLSIAWIVFTANAFNLLDNMDGVATSVAAVTAAFLTWSALASGHWGTALTLAVLAGACAGFLLHNWHPARIFLGDAGSLFIGFLLAAAAVTAHADDRAVEGGAAVLLTTLVSTADTALVMLSRRRAGRPLLLGGTDHLSHRMRRLGLTARQVASVLAVTAGASGLTGALVESGTLPILPVLALVALLVALGARGMLGVPVYDTTHPARRNRQAAGPVGEPRQGLQGDRQP